MKRGRRILIISILACIGLVILGIQWRSWDYDRIDNLEYQKKSRCIMQQDNIDEQELLRLVREMLKDNSVHVIKEYKIGKSIREITGLSGKFWLSSDYLDKFTIVDAVTKEMGRPETSRRQFLVFAAYIPTGSKDFLSIVLLCLMIIAGLSVKKKYLPHLFGETSEKQNSG